MDNTKVIVDFQRYTELLKIEEKSKNTNIVFSDKNHLYTNPKEFIKFLSNNVFREETIALQTPDNIRLEIPVVDDSIVVLNTSSDILWLRNTECRLLLKKFVSIDIERISNLKIGYIAGLVSPLLDFSKSLMVHSGDYYEVWIKIEYN